MPTSRSCGGRIARSSDCAASATWRPFTSVDDRVVRLDGREHLRIGEDVAGRVWESGRAERDSGFAVIPVHMGNRVAGVLEVQRPAGAFSDEALAALDGLAAQFGVLARAFEAEESLRETSVRYALLVEQIPAIVYTGHVGRGLTTLYVSPRIEAMLGVGHERLMAGRSSWEPLVHPEDRERTAAEFDAGVASGRPFAVEYRMIGLEGRVVWFRDEITLRNEDGAAPIVHGVMQDVTERRHAEEQVEFLALHDRLTALPNRAMLEERLELAIATAAAQDAALSVLYLDLDDFKLVNDSLGYEAGDELLRQVAARLRAATRDSDLVARQGGDEFLLLLSDLDRSGLPPAGDPVEHALAVALSVAERIRESLQSPFTLSGTELFTSASIGISVYPADATDRAGAPSPGARRDVSAQAARARRCRRVLERRSGRRAAAVVQHAAAQGRRAAALGHALSADRRSDVGRDGRCRGAHPVARPDRRADRAR